MTNNIVQQVNPGYGEVLASSTSTPPAIRVWRAMTSWMLCGSCIMSGKLGTGPLRKSKAQARRAAEIMLADSILVVVRCILHLQFLHVVPELLRAKPGRPESVNDDFWVLGPRPSPRQGAYSAGLVCFLLRLLRIRLLLLLLLHLLILALLLLLLILLLLLLLLLPPPLRLLIIILTMILRSITILIVIVIVAFVVIIVIITITTAMIIMSSPLLIHSSSSSSSSCSPTPSCSSSSSSYHSCISRCKNMLTPDWGSCCSFVFVPGEKWGTAYYLQAEVLGSSGQQAKGGKDRQVMERPTQACCFFARLLLCRRCPPLSGGNEQIEAHQLIFKVQWSNWLKH